MHNLENAMHDESVSVMDRIRNLSVEQMIVALRAKMTTREMMKCLEISTSKRIPLDQVFHKMASFKETSAHILYKEDFSFA